MVPKIQHMPNAKEIANINNEVTLKPHNMSKWSMQYLEMNNIGYVLYQPRQRNNRNENVYAK